MENSIHKYENKRSRVKDPTPMTESNDLISIYETHTQAEAAVKEMQQSGFDMKKLSIIGRDYQTEESIVGFYNTGDRVKLWGKRGAFWGGLWGVLFGSALFVIPGVGPLVVAGYFAATLVGAIEGAIVVGGLSAFGAALYSVGIPKDSVIQYEADLKAGRYVMIAHGTTAELKKAHEISKNTGGKNTREFDSKNSNNQEFKKN